MLQMGSMIYFGDTTANHKEQFGAFIRDIIDCTFGDVKNESIVLLNSFKKMMNEFQVCYTADSTAISTYHINLNIII